MPSNLMVNRKRKGQRLETQITNNLKRQGYEIFFKSAFIKFRCIDFGPWDIVAARGKERMLIQATSWANRAPRRKKCKNWLQKHALEGETGYLTAKKGGKIIWEKL